MLKLFDIEEFCLSLNEISSAKFFTDQEMTKFDSNGLFSEDIFGPVNSKTWRNQFAKINLNAKIINPIIFRLLRRMNRKIVEVILSSQSFSISDDGQIIEGNDFYGIEDIIKNWDKLKFPKGTPIRSKLSDFLMDKYKYPLFFMSSIPVIPPANRPIYNQGDKDSMLMYDEINDYYVKLIKNTQNSSSVSFDDKILTSSYTLKIQMIINEFYEFIKLKAGKKKGIMRGQLVSKRIDFSARSVIIGNPKLKANQIGIPLVIAVNLFKPFILHIMNSSTKPEWWDKETLPEAKLYNIDAFNLYLTMIGKTYKVPEEILLWINEICSVAMQGRYVLAKRDPSLRRESWMGYVPVLVDGYAIQMNPLSVGVHNADFDGDTMAICSPLSEESQEEIKNKMISNHSAAFFADYTKELSKDFLLGLYVLTK